MTEYICTEGPCLHKPFSTNHRTKIEGHIASKHLNYFPYICGICDDHGIEIAAPTLNNFLTHTKKFHPDQAQKTKECLDDDKEGELEEWIERTKQHSSASAESYKIQVSVTSSSIANSFHKSEQHCETPSDTAVSNEIPFQPSPKQYVENVGTPEEAVVSAPLRFEEQNVLELPDDSIFGTLLKQEQISNPYPDEIFSDSLGFNISQAVNTSRSLFSEITSSPKPQETGMRYNGETESVILLHNAGIKNAEQQIEHYLDETACPLHRHEFGPTQKPLACSYPNHTGKGKGNRGINLQKSLQIHEITGSQVHIGTRLCVKCRSSLEAILSERKHNDAEATNEAPRPRERAAKLEAQKTFAQVFQQQDLASSQSPMSSQQSVASSDFVPSQEIKDKQTIAVDILNSAMSDIAKLTGDEWTPVRYALKTPVSCVGRVTQWEVSSKFTQACHHVAEVDSTKSSKRKRKRKSKLSVSQIKRRVTCQLCQQSVQPSYKQNHITVHHLDVPYYYCLYCKYEGRTSVSLYFHVKTKHLGERSQNRGTKNVMDSQIEKFMDECFGDCQPDARM